MLPNTQINKRALALVALLVITVVVKSSLASPTTQNSRSINLHRRQAPNQPPAGDPPKDTGAVKDKAPVKVPDPVSQPAAPAPAPPQPKDANKTPPDNTPPAKDPKTPDATNPDPTNPDPTTGKGPTNPPPGGDPAPGGNPPPGIPAPGGNPPPGNPAPGDPQTPPPTNPPPANPDPAKAGNPPPPANPDPVKTVNPPPQANPAPVNAPTDAPKTPAPNATPSPLSTVFAVNTASTGNGKLKTLTSVIPESSTMVTKTLGDGQTTVVQENVPAKTVVVVTDAPAADGLDSSTNSLIEYKSIITIVLGLIISAFVSLISL
ncbi:hypothetical protein C1645_749965 [Glomus cerebriforme]|uniref:Uncharacterized protein n=1 Tax=Glomus cerebriforme TaxID=658196 RepID=A0A397TNJ1_9GLOM|nr:hypothetical protein C1645_749965 [Glomus cerebriforme]